jgi:multiple sugar transport system substrate-binding protein
MKAFRSNCFMSLVFFLICSLAGCDGSEPANDKKAPKKQAESPAVEEQRPDVHPLKGKSIEISILGIGEWFPSELIDKMAPGFSTYAREIYGYDVSVSFVGSSVWTLFDKASASLATGSQEFNIIVIDSQWLGAFAEKGWIASVNEIIQQYPELNIEWWDPIITETYMEYPIGSGRLWGFPQEADVIALFVRKDLFSDPAEQKAFKSKYNMKLPQTFEDFEDLSMKDFEKIASFFTRPEKGLYGTVLQYSKTYDFISMYLYPFMYSLGGEIWDPKNQKIYGLINSNINAEAMRWSKRMLAYQPSDVIQYGISENRDAFVQGKTATAIQWAAMAPAMMTEQNKGSVLIVPPPAFRQKDGSLQRIYAIGGQPWVINVFNDKAHMQAVVDFLKWWYLHETQLEFAKSGGNPSVRATLESHGFDALQPWFRAFKYMLTRKRAKDFWHHPKYGELLKIQQEVFAAYISGSIVDPDLALEHIACKQQEILFKSGSTNHAPPDSCVHVLLR